MCVWKGCRVRRAGLTRIDVFVLLAVLSIGLGLYLFSFRPAMEQPDKTKRIKCVNNLKNVGLAFRIFAADNNDRFPTTAMLTDGVAMEQMDALRVFLTLSNELSTPKILYCPADKRRKAAASFTNLALQNLSYFVSLSSAGETNPTAFLSGDRHLASNGVPLQAGLFPLTTNAALSWTSEIHHDHGHIVLGDGSVQMFTTNRLLQGVRDQELGNGTNYLVMP